MSRGLPVFPKKKRGRYFIIRITKADGSRPRIRLGATREEALNSYADYVKQLKSKKLSYPTYRATIKQGMDAYLEIKKNKVKPNSLTRFRGILVNFKRFIDTKHLYLVFLDELQERHFSEYMNYRESIGRSPITINFERDTLSNMFNILINEKNLELRNPVKKVGLLSQPVPDDFFYKSDEIMKILETAKMFSKRINWYAIFAALFYTGMRRNELRFLTWEDIDLEKGSIYIRSKQVNEKIRFEPKGKEIRTIPIHLPLMPILKSLSKKNDRWVFVNSRNKFIDKDKINVQFKKICRAVGLPVKKQHKTRHSWASLLTQDGVPLDVIQEIGGWKDLETMNKYKHLADDYKAMIFKEKFTLGGNNQKL